MPRIIEKVQAPAKPEKLLNVAAYARVSSGKDAMLHSLSAQVSFYSNLIQPHRWCLIKQVSMCRVTISH